MRRNAIAFTLGILLTSMLGVGALMLRSGSDEKSVSAASQRTQSGTADLSRDPAEIRDSLRGNENVMSLRGEEVGFMDGSSRPVQLVPGVTARPVYSHDGNGRVVGYMTEGDIGFVDLATANDDAALSTLATCYRAYHDYYWGGPDMPQMCPAAFEKQGARITLARPDPAQR